MRDRCSRPPSTGRLRRLHPRRGSPPDGLVPSVSRCWRCSSRADSQQLCGIHCSADESDEQTRGWTVVTVSEKVAVFFSREAALDGSLLQDRVAQALREDIGDGDRATETLLSYPVPGEAVIVAKADGVIAGLDVAVECFRQLDPEVSAFRLCDDAAVVRSDQQVLRLRGDLRMILTAERSALNFLRRMSGIATVTRAAVDVVAHTRCRVLDTRKTTPLLRMFDKYAVRVGGAWSHRDGLFDMCLVKENHIAAAGGLDRTLQLLGELPRRQLVEVEVSTIEDAMTVARAGVPLVLLDNMPLDGMRAAVDAMAEFPEHRRPALEASGNITVDNAAAVAETGVDYLSMGGLTHSVPDLDLSLLVTFDHLGKDS